MGSRSDKPTRDKERYVQADLTLKFDGSLKSIQIGYKYRDHETSQTYAGVTVAGVSAPASLFDPSGAGGNYLSGFDGVNDQMTGRFKIDGGARSEEHTSELQSLMRISYAVFCLKK